MAPSVSFLSSRLDIRQSPSYPTFSPATFVTWGGNSTDPDAKVYREGRFHGFKLKPFSPKFLFLVHSFSFVFSSHLLITKGNHKKKQT
jgi:hypothetical protein